MCSHFRFPENYADQSETARTLSSAAVSPDAVIEKKSRNNISFCHFPAALRGRLPGQGASSEIGTNRLTVRAIKRRVSLSRIWFRKSEIIMKHNVNSPQARDLRSHLHPFTNLAAHAEVGPSIFLRGDGIHVFDDAGRGYV